MLNNTTETVRPLAATPAARTLIYQSPKIHERRRRILHEARLMVQELGYENVSIRELSRRAKVAQRTLYNAFGSRENIVINAIYQYQQDFSDHVSFVYPSHTLTGRMERIVKVHSRNLQIRPYATAVMAVYNSQFSDPSIRQAIRKMSDAGTLPFVEHLAACRMLADGVKPQVMTDHLTRQLYATLSSWCAAEISDDSMVENMVETFLLVIYGSTRGGIKREAATWLGHLRLRSREWLDLKKKAVVPKLPRRATRRAGSPPVAPRP